MAQIQDMYSGGGTLQGIARTLNESGQRPRTGQWYASMIKRIVGRVRPTPNTDLESGVRVLENVARGEGSSAMTRGEAIALLKLAGFRSYVRQDVTEASANGDACGAKVSSERDT